MDAENYKIISLLLAFLNNDLDEKEYKILMQWVESSDENKSFFQRICKGEGMSERWELYKLLNVNKAYNSFASKTLKRRIGWQRIVSYAAVIVVLLSMGIVYWLDKREYENAVENIYAGALNADGKAYLTMDDGSIVALKIMDSVQILENGAQVLDSGRVLTYSQNGVKAKQNSINRLTTSRGGEYQIILEDGTRVFLNACSELTFPESFDLDKREVAFTGEAYFEVAKDIERPFYVNVGGVRICVLGTAFNVNTYQGNDIETVLVEGKIDIEDKMHKKYPVNPGQMAVFSQEGNYISLEEVDVEPYIAWRYGVYIFKNETLEQLMYKLSMWYDVDVLFEDASLKKHCFTGRIEKNEDLKSILRSLQYILDIHFTKEGNTIVISK